VLAVSVEKSLGLDHDSAHVRLLLGGTRTAGRAGADSPAKVEHAVARLACVKIN
jgi:hypothetical protein